MENKIEWKYDIGENIKDIDNEGKVIRDITITERKSIEYKGQFYKYKCNICGFDCGEHYIKGEYVEEYWANYTGLYYNSSRCLCCGGGNRIVVEGINDIPTTAPWMIKYFQGGYDEAKKYAKQSNVSIYPICSDCNRIKDKSMLINTIYLTQSIGCVCSDGISFPNKFMYMLLNELQEDFISEYSPEWADGKRYDFYIPSLNVIIEMDGSWHYKDNKLSGQSKKVSKHIDDLKDSLAKGKNIQVIRINCNYSGVDNRFKIIKDNVVLSELKNIFNLENIDWDKIREGAESSFMKKAWNIKKNNELLTAKDISKMLNMSNTTMTKWLKIGTELGECEYNPKLETKNKGLKIAKSKGTKIRVLKNDELVGEFHSISRLSSDSKDLLGVKLYREGISRALKENREYKGHRFVV